MFVSCVRKGKAAKNKEDNKGDIVMAPGLLLAAQEEVADFDGAAVDVTKTLFTATPHAEEPLHPFQIGSVLINNLLAEKGQHRSDIIGFLGGVEETFKGAACVRAMLLFVPENQDVWSSKDHTTWTWPSRR